MIPIIVYCIAAALYYVITLWMDWTEFWKKVKTDPYYEQTRNILKAVKSSKDAMQKLDKIKVPAFIIFSVSTIISAPLLSPFDAFVRIKRYVSKKPSKDFSAGNGNTPDQRNDRLSQMSCLTIKNRNEFYGKMHKSGKIGEIQLILKDPLFSDIHLILPFVLFIGSEEAITQEDFRTEEFMSEERTIIRRIDFQKSDFISFKQESDQIKEVRLWLSELQ